MWNASEFEAEPTRRFIDDFSIFLLAFIYLALHLIGENPVIEFFFVALIETTEKFKKHLREHNESNAKS